MPYRVPYQQRLVELRHCSKVEGDALREARGSAWSSDIALPYVSQLAL